jgi:hypothetical protein
MQTANRQNFAAQRRRPVAPWFVHARVTVRACACAVLLLAAVSYTGCISAPPKKQTAVEAAREETTYGSELARRFNSTIRPHGDPVVDKYLNKVANTLADSSKDPRLVGAHVVIILDRGGLWRTYSLPGERVYFSLGLLQQLRYDNEVAAAIALEFGNLLQSSVLKHLKMQQQGVRSFLEVDPAVKLQIPAKVDFYGMDGIFAFDVDEVKLGIKSAMDVLYLGGFDIRGMLQIWEIFEKNPQHSPYPDKILEDLMEYTRILMTRYAPMRNPVVRTEEFKAIQKRIVNL